VREPRPPAVARVIERVTHTARAHAMFAPGDLVLVWVSGGADSICLLETLVRVRRLLRIRLEVFHLNHGLRPDADRDADYVRRRAAYHGLACHVAWPSAPPARGESVERWAREQRRHAAAQVADAIGATRSALGHTMDDRAETVLLALVRGWGLDGLTGIEPVAGSLVRPLPDVRRSETQACCRSLRLRPRRDESNTDTTLLRNALRIDVIPAMERATRRDVTPTIARTAELLRADAVLLDEIAAGSADRIVVVTDDSLRLDADGLNDLASSIASRVVRAAFADAGLTWSEPAIAGVLDLAAGRPGRRTELPEGVVARRNRAHVVIQR
jgi:tRNA(Ile)-lysidine synthase